MEIKCDTCGKKSQRNPNKTHWKNKFCAIECRKAFQIGENSAHWKGGRIIDSHGYVAIRVPGSKFGYILEHRYVMEKHLGVKLNRSQIVHHINGNKTDNRIENLEILSRPKHASVHMIGNTHGKGRTPWNKGKKLPYSPRPKMRGRAPWNKAKNI